MPSATRPGVASASAWESGIEKLQSTGSDFVAGIPGALIALAVVACFWFVGWAIRRSARFLAKDELKHRNLALVRGRLIQDSLIVLGVLVAAVIVFPNFTPTSLITSLGIGGLALGIAFKDVLEDYLVGILMLLTEPFRIGDQIVFGEYEGTVEEIQTRATSIRIYDGRRVVVPNAVLLTAPSRCRSGPGDHRRRRRRRVQPDPPVWRDSVAVTLRLLEAIRVIAQSAKTEPWRRVLRQHAETINSQAKSISYETSDLQNVQERYDQAMAAMEASAK